MMEHTEFKRMARNINVISVVDSCGAVMDLKKTEGRHIPPPQSGCWRESERKYPHCIIITTVIAHPKKRNYCIIVVR
jgi:hypothetical protein